MFGLYGRLLVYAVLLYPPSPTLSWAERLSLFSFSSISFGQAVVHFNKPLSVPNSLCLSVFIFSSICFQGKLRAGGRGFPPATMNVVPGSRLLSLENERKTEPKEIPGCLISRPLVVFTRQLKILVTTLKEVSPKFDDTIIISLKYGYLLQKCVFLSTFDTILQGPLKDY